MKRYIVDFDTHGGYDCMSSAFFILDTQIPKNECNVIVEILMRNKITLENKREQDPLSKKIAKHICNLLNENPIET